GGSWYWTLFGEGTEVPVSISLLNDASTTPISTSNDFPIYYTQNGCTYCYEVNYYADYSQTGQYSFGSLTIAATPSTNVELYTYSTSSGSGQWWCYWLVSGLCQDVVFSSGGGGSVAYYYYQIWEELPYMNVIDGGSPPAVSFDYTTLPASPGGTDSPLSTSVTLSTGSTVVYPLPESTASVATCDPSGLHSNGIFRIAYCGTNFGALPSERWDTGVCSTSFLGICTEDITVAGIESITNINYWNQFLEADSYSVSGGGTPSAPTLNSAAFGSAYSATLSTSVNYYWLNSGASWSISPNPLGGSSSSERWQTNSAVSGTISASATVAPVYYNQYLVGLSYFTSDGNPAPSNPSFTGTSFGASTGAITLTTSANDRWLDAGSSWSVSPATLVGSTSTQRWIATTTTGTITSSSPVDVEYFHQFFVKFAVSPASSGTAPATGWYNANTPISITATPAAGFAFSKWTTTALITFGKAKAASTTMTVGGSGTVKAKFLASVKISLNPSTGSAAPGHTVTTKAKVSGSPQNVTMSAQASHTGISVTWVTNPITDSLTGVTDKGTIHVASTVPAGTYTVTITATGADGKTASATFTLTVS
ncbi:MAG: InlB B-repeat-containing protein, partial [Nitrososphaerales archaeon]